MITIIDRTEMSNVSDHFCSDVLTKEANEHKIKEALGDLKEKEAK